MKKTEIEQIKKDALHLFETSLSEEKNPSDEAIKLIVNKVEDFLQKKVLSFDISEKVKEKLRVMFCEEKIKLTPLTVVVTSQPSIFLLSLFALAGSCAGIIATARILLLFSTQNMFALMYGGAIGAFCFTWLIGKLSTCTRLGARFLKKNHVIDKSSTLKVFDSNIETWINQIFLVIDCLSKINYEGNSNNEADEILVFLLSEIEKINSLKDKNDVNSEIDYMYKYLSKYGYNIPKQENDIWTEALIKFYDSYGLLENGDKYIIEKEAIVKGSDIIKKGLVRKKR